MRRASRLVVVLAVLSLLVLPGCTAFQQLAALRTVTFAFSHLSDVRLAGIPLEKVTDFSSLGVVDLARLAAAAAARQVPLELVAHVSATNPGENRVAARMVDCAWTLFVEDRQALSGGLAGAVSIDPGRTADVPLAVKLDLAQLGGGGARDLFDLALAIAGQGTVKKDLRLELTPTIETPLGPIRYPVPVTVRRSVAGS
jgi:hypothetical protein